MAKLQTLISIVSGYLSNSQLNTNFQRISIAFQNTLSRDGSGPNQMLANLDMNSNRVINHPDPVDDTDLVTKGYADGQYGGSLLASAQASAASAAASASSAATSAGTAALLAGALVGTSTTSHTVGTGVKVFTTQASKDFPAGQFVLIPSQANANNYMHGQVVSYSGTTLTVNVTNTGGSGTYADWNIYVSGTRGPQGPAGAAGAGTGDMLAANNLSDLTNLVTARTNLGLSNLAELFFINREVPGGVKNGVNVTFTLAATPTVGTEQFYRNGVLQNVGAGNDYTISGLTLTLARAPESDEELLVSYLKP